MERDSLGLIETSGLVAAIEASDAGSKAASVSFRGYQCARAGLITVVFQGDVAAVRAAVTAGSAAAKRVGTVISVHVIARPDRQLHLVSNGAKPIAKLASSPPAECVVPLSPSQADFEPAPAEAPGFEESVRMFSASAAAAQVPQTEAAPALPVAQPGEVPASKDHFQEEKHDAEAATTHADDDGHRVQEEEPEEDMVVAAHVSLPARKERLRKPKSKRKA